MDFKTFKKSSSMMDRLKKEIESINKAAFSKTCFASSGSFWKSFWKLRAQLVWGACAAV